jgi:radical SAM protein with 4Fe4S-binding SPASM domain
LGFDEYKRLLDELRELGCFEVVFTGGEPATYHQLTDLCEYARNLRFSVSIKTNAALLDDDTIARLRQLHITEVQTSLYSMKPEVHDGITRSKGSWAATTTALQEMYSAGQRLRLACVVMQSNFQHLSGLRAFARTINAPISFDLIVQARTDGSCGSVSERLLSSQLKWLDETGVFRNEIFVGSNPQVKPGDEVGYGMTRYLPKDPDSRVCGAANTLIAINPTGTVFPCVSFNLPLGNIRNTPLQTILTNQTSNRLRSYRNRSFEECKRCQLEEACPRCMATNYAEKGHPLSRVNYVCEVAYWMSKYAATQPG